MNKDFIRTALEKMNSKVFFFILFLYQLLFIFQGIDFADEGYFATFYQQIFNDPGSVEFNFMYWLTGIVGGIFHYFFPHLGLIGFKILGVLITTLTLILSYNILKKYLNIYHLKLGILFTIIIISNDPKELNYDNLSILLFISSIYFLFKGLKDEKIGPLFICGLFLGLNIFTRVTNILGLVLLLPIVYAGVINKISIRKQIKQIIALLCGFVLMMGFILLLMKVLKHYDIFTHCLDFVFNMGTKEESGHNFFKVIKRILSKYSLSFIYVAIVFISIVLINKINSLTKLQNKYYREIAIAFKVLTFVLIFILLLKGKIQWSNILLFFVGLSLITSSFILITSENKNIKLLTFIGVLLLLFYPLGSEEYVEMFSMWIILPITIDYLFNIQLVNSKTYISTSKIEHEVSIFFSENELAKIKSFLVYVCLIICLFFAYFYPYFDISNRLKMHYTVDNIHLKGIYTTHERAKVINELLIESSKYIKKNDFVLAYDCIPMFHYLTETKPYLRNSWPWLYVSDDFKNALDISENKKLPVVVVQKVNTLNTDWPETQKQDYSTLEINANRNHFFNEFLKKNNYTKVWGNEAFEILIAQ